MKERKGITLISLVITIVLLLILAAVAINLAVDSDGLFAKAEEAATAHNTAVEAEGTEINNLLNMLEAMAKCSHVWENGTCSKCGEACEHAWANGECSQCGLRCDYVVTTTEEFAQVMEIVATGSTIGIDGQVDFPGNFTNAANKQLTFVGMREDASISYATNVYSVASADLVFKNLTINTVNEMYSGFIHAGTIEYYNCAFNNLVFNNSSEAVIFENCIFYQSTNNLSATFVYGSPDTVYSNCTFYCVGRGANIYNDGSPALNVTFNKCNFIGSGTYINGAGKPYAAIVVDTSNTDIVVNINDCKATGFLEGEDSGNNLWTCIAGNRAQIFVNGEQVL